MTRRSSPHVTTSLTEDQLISSLSTAIISEQPERKIETISRTIKDTRGWMKLRKAFIQQ